jgi:CRISPR-associated exonuclease Cas4
MERKYDEDELLPISALQHLLYCERRAALVHLERAWAENASTVEGSHLHERTDTTSQETRGLVLVSRGLIVSSTRLGLYGKVDTIEWVPCSAGADSGVEIRGFLGLRSPVVVEYKVGRLRKEEGYEVQLCAQALCIEEMLGIRVDAGAIYYGQNRRRLSVRFDGALRLKTEAAAERLHALISSGVTPPPARNAKCEKCSLADVCNPAWSGARSARRYVGRILKDEQEGEST